MQVNHRTFPTWAMLNMRQIIWIYMYPFNLEFFLTVLYISTYILWTTTLMIKTKSINKYPSPTIALLVARISAFPDKHYKIHRWVMAMTVLTKKICWRDFDSTAVAFSATKPFLWLFWKLPSHTKAWMKLSCDKKNIV